MSEQSPSSMNGTDPVLRLEAQLLATARALPYPPEPNLVVLLRQRVPAPTGRPVAQRRHPAPRLAPAPRWVWAAAVIALLLAALAVPAVRSGVIDFLRLGAVRFQFSPTATPTPVPNPTGTPPAATSTPAPTATPLPSVLDLAGQTTLASARDRAEFTIGLPTYPAGLGEPDLVFMQDLDGQAVVLVWLQPDDSRKVRMSLHILTSGTLTDKMIKNSPPIEFTRVHGREAIWTSGPYFIVARNGSYAQTRLIEGHVLIWTAGSLTYRLETDLSKDEAVRVAESAK